MQVVRADGVVEIDLGPGREVLDRYREPWLRVVLFGSAALAFVAYCGWALELPVVDGVPWRPITIVPMAAVLLRYGALVRRGEGEAPEQLVFGDRALALAGLAWLVVFALSVHATN